MAAGINVRAHMGGHLQVSDAHFEGPGGMVNLSTQNFTQPCALARGMPLNNG
jgi:hypothetical protein